MQVYENKTLHMLNKTIDDEPVCCMCVTKDKIVFFSNYNVRYKNFGGHRLRNTAEAHLNNIKLQFLFQRKYNASPLQESIG
jgi:hypothetical protein